MDAPDVSRVHSPFPAGKSARSHEQNRATPKQIRAHVFADINGYSQFVKAQGEDEAAKLLRTFERIVRKTIATRDVEVEKTADVFHLIFRLPIEAVRCGVDIADAIARYNAHATVKLRVKFGVDAGQAVRRGAQYVGYAPVLASRLSSRAKPGQVLVSETVHSLIRTTRLPTLDLGNWKTSEGTTLRVYEARPPDERESAPEGVRFLTALFFTDIVRSTASAAAAGDRRWRDTVERHDAIVREELDRYGGTEIDTAGDGFYAAFDSPSQAIRCAFAAGERAHAVGVDIRAGVHIGECEIVSGKIGGIAVSIGARIKDRAGPREVLVSQAVKDSLVGSSFTFADHGRHELKGVPGEWQILSVVRNQT
jgi:class 3 adenylate cyclase